MVSCTFDTSSSYRHNCSIPHDTLPFDVESIQRYSIDIAKSTFLTIASHDKSYPLVLQYVAANLTDGIDHQSFEINAGQQTDSFYDDDKIPDESSLLAAGIGLHQFQWNEETMYCLRQLVGTPVGTRCNAVCMENIVLFYPKLHAQKLLHNFVDAVVAASEVTGNGYISIFRWHIDYCYWRKGQRTKTRPIETVILPPETKSLLFTDLDDFVSEDTKAFYEKHGIPYRRSYLFYGLPGTGKTSLIQSLAGHYERNIYFLQPTHPRMTDDSLRSAVDQIPRRSILVLEDIDALFGKNREKKIEQSPLTFSGLLNAIDGVGGSNGHIVILTTNFRHEIDDALIRNGRVDIHVPFESTKPAQMQEMFLAFYPTATSDQAKTFASALTTSLEQRQLSTAILQHYFVTQRRKTAAQAISNVDQVAQIIDQRMAAEDEDDTDDDDSNDDEDESGDDEEVVLHENET